MEKIAIVTDSNSGITQEEGRRLGVSVLPMPFYINDVMYLEGITLTQEEFYEKLKNDEAISTSQPSPAEVCGLWDNLLKEYDEVVHIPMSSGLSASCETARHWQEIMMAECRLSIIREFPLHSGSLCWTRWYCARRAEQQLRLRRNWKKKRWNPAFISRWRLLNISKKAEESLRLRQRSEQFLT